MLLGFLEGYDADARGRKLHEIWEFSDNQIESTHDFIQWLFPLTEPSQSQPDAPVLVQKKYRLSELVYGFKKYEVFSRLVFGFPDAE